MNKRVSTLSLSSFGIADLRSKLFEELRFVGLFEMFFNTCRQIIHSNPMKYCFFPLLISWVQCAPVLHVTIKPDAFQLIGSVMGMVIYLLIPSFFICFRSFFSIFS